MGDLKTIGFQTGGLTFAARAAQSKPVKRTRSGTCRA